MSEIDDKRQRSDLDMFVLALIDSGLTTPYELQRRGGLSPGATIPALRRLSEARLVLSGNPGTRGRSEHKITADGRRRLEGSWLELVNDGPSGDLDADLRVALIALVVGGDRPLAAKFLRESATRMRGSAKVPRRTREPECPLVLADCYRNLRALAAESVAESRAAAVSQLARMLPSIQALQGQGKRRPTLKARSTVFQKAARG